jgi:hypothetical protein
MEMTRNQASRMMAVAILLVIGGAALLVLKGILLNPLARYIIAGIIIVVGIAMFGERNKFPAFITLLIGIAIILVGNFAKNLMSVIGWVVLFFGIIMGLISFSAVKKTM